MSKIGCDGPNDCPGQVCCYVSNPAGAYTGCFDSCPQASMQTTFVLCDPAASACASGTTCTAATLRMTTIYECR